MTASYYLPSMPSRQRRIYVGEQSSEMRSAWSARSYDGIKPAVDPLRHQGELLTSLQVLPGYELVACGAILEGK